MTVNALRPSAKLLRQQTYTQNDLMVDPLIVLRCDQRVYRYRAGMEPLVAAVGSVKRLQMV